MAAPSLFDPFKALEEARRTPAEPSRKLPQKLPQMSAEANRELYQSFKPTSATPATSAGVSLAPVLVRALVQKEEEEKIQLFHILTRGERGVDGLGLVNVTTPPAEVAEAAEVGLNHSDVTIYRRDASAEVFNDGLRKWIAAVERLSDGRVPCPGYRPDEWSRVLSRAIAFLHTFGVQAKALGWTAPRLFGVHPIAGVIRPDACGALMLAAGAPVRAIAADTIRLGHLTYREKPGQPQGVPVWEFGR